MSDRTDIFGVGDAAWERAVAREAVVRRLACKASPSRADVLAACRDLGLKRSRIYELIRAYKARPATSSLLTAQAGSPAGRRRLPDEIEVLISEAIASFFKSRQKPSIHALQTEVRILRLIETAAEAAVHSGRERLDAESFGDDLVLPLVSMTQSNRRRSRQTLQPQVSA